MKSCKVPSSLSALTDLQKAREREREGERERYDVTESLARNYG